MKRRTKGVLLIGSLVVATAVATVVMLAGALARAVDPHHYCDAGFSELVDCSYHWSSQTKGPSGTSFTASAYVDVTSWAVADCPHNYIAKSLLCAAPSVAAPAQAASDDLATGLPRPKPWLLTTGKNSRFIESVHVETPLDLAAVLGFYRAELGKRGWKESDGAVVEPDRAVIPFTIADGPALLRLTHQDDRTIADLSLRKSAATNTAILAEPGQARLLFGNYTDEEAAITINEQTIRLAARAGADLTDDPETEHKSRDSREINLAPGKYEVTFAVASGAAQRREFEVGADETWGLVVGSAGVPIPLHLH